MVIDRKCTVLFQGDSITYAGRSYEDDRNLGMGYAMMASAWFSAMHPELEVKFLNRGCSGDTTLRLKQRWQKDCIDLQPDVVSILIGINDTWRRYDSNEPTSLEEFRSNYDCMLGEIKSRLSARIIMCEPFLLASDMRKLAWREDLDPKIDAARELAREYGAVYIPFDGIFAAASTRRIPEYWAADGIHPTHAGHALMARHWLEAVNAL